MTAVAPAFAQTAPQAAEEAEEDSGEIIVTAQRRSESLQDVPIAVSAFSAEALEKQQIENSSDLQLSLPNITAKPDLTEFKASAEGEYGNFDAIKFKGMINVPIGDTLGLRVAGYYLKRDGYTKNLFTGNNVDGRNMYGMRATLRWEPSENTRVELMGYYFREKDDRLRIQKQQCLRDNTGVLGCLPSGRAYETPNTHASFIGTLTSRESPGIAGGAVGASLGLTSLYGPDLLSTQVNPADPRVLNIDYEPRYFTNERQFQARFEHDFGPIKAQLTGMYTKSRVNSQQDVAQAVYDRTLINAGLANFAVFIMTIRRRALIIMSTIS